VKTRKAGNNIYYEDYYPFAVEKEMEEIDEEDFEEEKKEEFEEEEKDLSIRFDKWSKGVKWLFYVPRYRRKIGIREKF